MFRKIGVFLLMFLGFFFINNIGVVYSAPVSGEPSNIKKLSVEKITVISENKLELLFSNNILADKELDFFLKHGGREEDFSNINYEGKIEEITNIKKIDVNGKKIYLFPNDKFKNKEEYEIVIISVTDINKNTIESGLDGAIKFIVPADFEEKQKAKRKKILERRNFRTKEMNRVFYKVKNELYNVSDIEFSTTIEVEEALEIKEKQNKEKQKYKEQLEKEKEEKKLEEIRKRKLEEKRKEVLELRRKKLIEDNEKKKELLRLSEIERKKLEEEKRALEDSLNKEQIDLTSGISTGEENLEGRSIEKVNLAGRELTPNHKANDLPEAGTREYLILIFSLIFVGSIFYFRRQKKA